MIRRPNYLMFRRPRRAGLVAVLAAGTVLLGSTGAYAYWTTTGTGTGSAASTTMQAPTVSAGAVSGTLLYPGLAGDGTHGGDLNFAATNPNPFPISVTVTLSAQPTQCTTPALSLVADPAERTFTLGADEGPVAVSLANVVGMGTGSSSDCQGKTFAIPLSTSSTSN